MTSKNRQLSNSIPNLCALRDAWTPDDMKGVGRTLYEAVPNDERPDWAAALLLQVMAEEYDQQELNDVVDLGLSNSADKWAKAHNAFGSIRKLTMAAEKPWRNDRRLQFVLDVGKTAAKIIYNASGRPAPFDYHAGWLMAPRIRRIVEDRRIPHPNAPVGWMIGET